MTTNFKISAPPNFSFQTTVFSHGWCALEPFSVIEKPFTLSYAAVIDGLPVDIKIAERIDGAISIRVRSDNRLTTTQRRECIARIKTMLRMEEPFDVFYKIVNSNPKLRWIKKSLAGRMLRCGTFFEDLIKVICTTNCSWALTTLMVKNLCRTLGEVTPSGQKTFPSPDAIAAQSESFMRKEIRAGYRAPYILELAEQIASGTNDVEQFRHSDKPTNVLYNELISLKGVGPYAAESLLKLIGRYDHLALDSWTRKKYYELYHNGRRVSDKTIVKRYGKFGEWAGLVFWLEMTKYWYREKFPL